MNITMNATASILDVWEGLKIQIFVILFFKKTQFSMKVYLLKMSQMKSDYIFL